MCSRLAISYKCAINRLVRYNILYQGCSYQKFWSVRLSCHHLTNLFMYIDFQYDQYSIPKSCIQKFNVSCFTIYRIQYDIPKHHYAKNLFHSIIQNSDIYIIIGVYLYQVTKISNKMRYTKFSVYNIVMTPKLCVIISYQNLQDIKSPTYWYILSMIICIFRYIFPIRLQ